MTGDDFPGLEQTSLPPNLFALVDYLNGGPSHLGCVAVVAAAAAFVCLDLYLLAAELGARPDVALRTTMLCAALPSFLYYTSDTYKDGFATLFVLGILGRSVRLARRFSVLQLAGALVLAAGLWLTRFYLVFIMPVPLLLGLIGVRSGSVVRTLLMVLVLGAGLAAVFVYSKAPEAVSGHAVHTFQQATSQNVLEENADSGSGVTLGTGPASFPLRLAYTLFSPFPWQSGSIGLQIGKLEALVWYYFFYRAVRAGRVLWRERRSDFLILASFFVPVTVAYAFTFANIGLIVRERIGIVLATIAVAALSWSSTATSPVPARAAPSAPPARGLPRRALARDARLRG
jgi:hypothetical protein